MNKSQLQVKEFHEAFGVPVHTTPQCTISKERALLRAKLIFEEAKETVSALGFNPDGLFTGCPGITGDFNLVEVADGLADLIYVINGCALELGIDLEPVLDCVHASNMSKQWSAKELESRPEGTTFEYARKGSITKVYSVKRADGKILKSPSYSPANIAKVLDDQRKGKV